ncbi:heme/hemin ABC transporter substrate-binding protein [Salinibius halmophilus]|uniref:heme/hemin ABC transporter substrate-binding protein n=1 Tax=Salinibius halmophilus TaxID=1853216 RepID=UPI0013144602|nr:helical backbone metal receptor [Salinibius halmophilus]
MRLFSRTLAAASLVTAMVCSSFASNLVTIDGAITETAYALGAGDRIVAVDTTSSYPAAATELPNVGYVRALSAEGVMSVAPDIIVTNQDAGPAEAISQLTDLGVTVYQLQMDYSAEGVATMIQQVGEAIGETAAGIELANEFRQQMAEVTNQQHNQRVMFVMNSSRRGLMVAGSGSRAHALIELAGATNAFADMQGYKPLSAEVVAMADPDMIMIMHSEEGPEFWQDHIALKNTKAAINGRIHIIDGLDLLTFGPRLPQAVAQVQTWLGQ